jgi:hypothetical protein
MTKTFSKTLKSSGDRAFLFLLQVTKNFLTLWKMTYLKKIFQSLQIEAIVWVAGLVALMFIDPASHHFTVCPLANLGFDFCPGCGLGRSIAFLYRGEFVDSFQTHPLGFFAVFILSFRIFHSIKQHKSHGTSN